MPAFLLHQGRPVLPKRGGVSAFAEGWATAKEGEARARARQALRPVSPEEETLVRNLADAAESFPSIEGADLKSLDGADPKPSSRAIISRTNLPQQFDEYVWFDETRAVTPLDTAEIKGIPDTYPFGV